MSMIYLGESHYFDTDSLDNCDYAMFCKHKNNLENYYNKRKDRHFVEKAKLIGLDINQLISEAEDFVYSVILGYEFEKPEYPWRVNESICKEVMEIIYNIANNIEE